jgi:hypothetical protein
MLLVEDAFRRKAGHEQSQNVESTLSRFQRWAKRLVGAETAKKRTEITVETDRILIIRRRRVIRGWCQECGAEVDLVTLQDAGAIAKMSLAALQDRPQAQALHFCQGLDGAPLICLESLLKSL